MTMPDPWRNQTDPKHIWAICAAVAPTSERDGFALLAGDYYTGLRLPSRAASRAAHTALTRVGYDVIRGSGRELVIRGWSTAGLDARLTSMRAVMHQLATGRGTAAVSVLEQFRRIPAGSLPGRSAQRQLVREAGQGLREWVFAVSGVHAPCDPLARPADTGIAVRLSAAWRAEEAIEELASRQMRVAAHATAIYPGLRQQMSHDNARDTAIRRAGVVFHLRGDVAQDSTGLLAVFSRPAAALLAGPGELPGRSRTAGRAGAAAGDFPVPGPPPLRLAPRPGGRPQGRDFPAGPARRRPAHP
ncbi:MAG TPA: hypothetical protein VGG25_16730 [Streptosporangiaceae bacterium]|jgi:hypothetical protein